MFLYFFVNRATTEVEAEIDVNVMTEDEDQSF